MITEYLYAVKIIRKDKMEFFSSNATGRFTAWKRSEAVAWKRSLAKNMPCSIKRIKVVKVIMQEVV